MSFRHSITLLAIRTLLPSILGTLLMAAVAAILFHADIVRSGEATKLLDSDGLYVPMLSNDIITKGPHALGHWFLTPAPYYFPDIFWGVFSAWATGMNIPDEILAIGTLQLISLALAPLPLMVFVLKQRSPRKSGEKFRMNTAGAFLTSALLLSIILGGFNLLYKANGLPMVNLLTIWPILSGHHFGAILLSVLLPGLCLLSMVGTDSRSMRSELTLQALLWLLITISVASDIFLFLWFSVPYLLTTLLIIRSGSRQAPTQGMGLTVLGSSLLGLHLFYTTNPALSHAYRPPKGLGESLAGFLHLASYMEHNAILYLVASPLALILLLASLRCYARSSKPALGAVRTSLELRTPIVYILTLVLTACVAPILQGHFQTYDEGLMYRYVLILAFIPLLALHAACLLQALALENPSGLMPLPARGKAAFAAFLLLLSLTCLGAFRSERKGIHVAYEGFKRPTIPATMNSSDCAYALYWDAKHMRTLFGIDTVQVSSLDSLNGYEWITNKDWLPSKARGCRFAIDGGRVVAVNTSDP